MCKFHFYACIFFFVSEDYHNTYEFYLKFRVKAKKQEKSTCRPIVKENRVCTIGAWGKLKTYVKEHPTAPFQAIRTLQEITDEEIHQMFEETVVCEFEQLIFDHP